MTPDSIINIGQQTLYTLIQLLLVLLIPALIVGLVISMFQAATQINEMTLSFIPKLLVTIMVLAIGGPWILQTMMSYTQRLIRDIPYLIG